MDQGQADPQDVEDGHAAGLGRFAAVVAVLSVALLATAVLAAVDPGLLVVLLPGWFTGPTSWGRTLQIGGGLALATPVLLVAVASVRGRPRAAGWFVVLALLTCVPAAATINYGASKVRQVERDSAPVVERCVEYSGGEAKCPGG